MGKNCYFSIFPLNTVIKENQIQNFIASFNPKSAGIFILVRKILSRNCNVNL